LSDLFLYAPVDGNAIYKLMVRAKC